MQISRKTHNHGTYPSWPRGVGFSGFIIIVKNSFTESRMYTAENANINSALELVNNKSDDGLKPGFIGTKHPDTVPAIYNWSVRVH